MLIKSYIVLLAVSIAVMSFFSLYSWSWLGSIGSPVSAVAGYEYHAGLSWPFLWLSASILLILANSILWISGRLWPIWGTLLYFQAFVLIRAFWLDRALLGYKNAAGMTDSTFTVAPIMAALLIVIAGAIVFFDQFLVLRLRAKTYPGSEETSAAEHDPPSENPRPE